MLISVVWHEGSTACVITSVLHKQRACFYTVYPRKAVDVVSRHELTELFDFNIY